MSVRQEIRSRKSLNHPINLLFDLYHRNLRTLDAMITKLAIPLLPHQQYSPPPQTPENLQLITDFFYPFGSTPEDALAGDTIYLSQINTDRQNLGIQDKDLANYIDSRTRGFSQDSGHTYQTPRLPGDGDRMWVTIQRRYEAQLQKHYRETEELISQFLDAFVAQSSHHQAAWPTHDASEFNLAAEISHVQTISPRTRSFILFAVSGSGKTRSIQGLLSQHFGFYFQSCQVPFEDVTGIHSAKRIPGSKDTLSLGKMIQHSLAVTNGVLDVHHDDWISTWFHRLVENRVVVLDKFLSTAKTKGIAETFLPKLWLDLQLNSKVDFFDKTFQLFSLINPGHNFCEMMKVWESITPQWRKKKLYFCLDEAQADLTTEVCMSGHKVSLLNVWAWGLTGSIDSLHERWKTKKLEPLIISGTSLRTTEAVEAVKNDGWPITLPVNLRETKSHVFSTFPAIKNSTQFIEAMQKHGLGNLVQFSNGSATYPLNLILEHAIPLYGRPRWSVQYLERIKALPNGPNFQEGIRNAAANTMAEVREDLQNRLRRLQDSARLMEDLCRVTVWGDLLDRPTPFWNHFGPTMIQEAFGTIRKTTDKESQYFLEERLALDAAKEFFLAKMPDLVHDMLGKFLEEQAHANTTFGKAAEYFLAWNLYRAFADDANRLSGSKDANRLQGLLTVLSSAAALNPNSSLDLSGYTLAQGDTIGHAYDGSVELTEWLSSLRQGEQLNATFYLPDNIVGPDLVFALRPNSTANQDVVLCLLQVKCGETDIAHAVYRTDLANAYHTYPTKRVARNVLPGHEEKYNNLQTELPEWRGRLRVLRVVVSAAETKKSSKKLMVKNGTSCAEYFIHCDYSQTELLFGLEFQGLLAAVKSKTGSLSEVYRKINGVNILKRKRTDN
ncbi:hypothetical protein NA56DRAFT_694828 [Hyaloscypha hepaticicola]|uniref:Uncharacterized protein n=1 Tax=Hyaloscypha hepaticicola TaxID=2082293 RepID=A0A2J6PHG6_9HELO|nr:hypothetical protein NA56DRAFT_694828 [Hyaloscypha hepaticicola]